MKEKLVIGVSSRALFDLQQAHEVFEQEGVAQYQKYISDLDFRKLGFGVAYPLISKLLKINSILEQDTEQNQNTVTGIDIVLLSRNSSETGVLVAKAIKHHRLKIGQGVFSGGRSIAGYAKAMGVELFLSQHAEDVNDVGKTKIAAAQVSHPPQYTQSMTDEVDELRIAFDGDSVLFSNESDLIFDSKGIEAFEKHEEEKSKLAIAAGPLTSFAHKLQQIVSNPLLQERQLIRTALVTARGMSTSERALNTLQKWDLRIDEACFLSGTSKLKALQDFKPDFFFDDSKENIDSVKEAIASGKVATE